MEENTNCKNKQKVQNKIRDYTNGMYNLNWRQRVYTMDKVDSAQQNAKHTDIVKERKTREDQTDEGKKHSLLKYL